jgi:L-lactate dehydrogenase complex protein LldG
VSITDAPAGLADTGALLVWSHEHFGRSSTLVTPVHITLLPASRILPDLVDGLAFVQQQNPGLLPSNIVVINGPSKTGDIEMKLVVGVHGPKYLYVLLLDGM